MNINLQKPPGTYQLVFEVMAMNDELNNNMSVTVVGCGPGEVVEVGEWTRSKALWDEMKALGCIDNLGYIDSHRTCPLADYAD